MTNAHCVFEISRRPIWLRPQFRQTSIRLQLALVCIKKLCTRALLPGLIDCEKGVPGYEIVVVHQGDMSSPRRAEPDVGRSGDSKIDGIGEEAHTRIALDH